MARTRDKRKTRYRSLAFSTLEGRILLSNEQAVWHGQDGMDYTSANKAGPGGYINPNGYQDIHISLSSLLPYEISEIHMNPQIGGKGATYLENGADSNAVLIRASNTSSTAELYTDDGSPLDQTNYPIDTFTITYKNGGSTFIDNVSGLPSTPSTATDLKSDLNLRDTGESLQVNWVGQSGDWTGPGPAVGPDGITDLHFHLTNLSAYSNYAYSYTPFFNSQLDSLLIWATTTGGQTVRWQTGMNAQGFNNAEVFVDPNSYNSTTHTQQADLYINPTAIVNGLSTAISGLAGQTIHVQLTYANDGLGGGKTDNATATVGSYSPTLAYDYTGGGTYQAPGQFQPLAAQWGSQDSNGAAHIALSAFDQISPAQTYSNIVGATLSDEAGSVWQYPAGGLSFSPGSGSTSADLAFNPSRNEIGSELMLRVVFQNPSTGVQTTAVAQIAGGSVDPTMWGAKVTNLTPVNISPTAANSLQLAVNNNPNGTLFLTAGNYVMTQTLILNAPITVNAAPGVTVTFADPTGQAWTNAVTIGASHVTLNGFTIQFDKTNGGRPDLWVPPQNVIGISGQDSMAGIVIKNMSIYGPLSTRVIANTPGLPAPGVFNDEAIDLINFLGQFANANGSVLNNIFKGGYLEFGGGPWLISGNDHQGTQPDTYAYTAFRFSYTHDVTAQGNLVHDAGSMLSPPTSGQLARSFYLRQEGYNDTISDNSVFDGVQWQSGLPLGNAPENILSETDNLAEFEGHAPGVYQNGYVLWIPPETGGVSEQRGGPIWAGDTVAIISGSGVGTWVRISQVIDDTKGIYLLDAPLSTDVSSYVISITRGFTSLTIANNLISLPSVIPPGLYYQGIALGGSQFNNRVSNNHIVGGTTGLIVQSDGTTVAITSVSTYPPTQLAQAEQNGWTHLPVFGLVVDGNVVQDTLQGGNIGVLYSVFYRASQGRTFFTATFDRNEVIWDSSFLSSLGTAVPSGFSIGTNFDTGYIAADPTNGNTRLITPPDPNGNIISAAGNWVQLPAGSTVPTTFVVYPSVINGATVSSQSPITDSKIWSTSPQTGNGNGGPLGIMIGQDDQNVIQNPNTQSLYKTISGTLTLLPYAVQDVHLVLSGIDPTRTIKAITILPPGYAGYLYGTLPTNVASFTSQPVYLMQSSGGASTIDLFFQPNLSYIESGKTGYAVTVYYNDPSNPNTSTPSNTVSTTVYAVLANPILSVVTPLPASLAAPLNLSATLQGSGQVNLSWDAVPGALGYSVERSTNGSTGWSVINSPSGTGYQPTTTYSDTGVGGSTVYYYRVRALFGTSYGSYSSVANVSTGYSLPTGTVALASGSSTAIGSYASDSAYVTGGATYYNPINIDTSGVIDPAPTAVYQTGRYSATSFTYAIPGLTPNARYTVRLHFAEFAYSDINSRLFNVSINSTQVLSNFNIYAAAGNAMYRAVVEQFNVQTDATGKITIVYSAVAGHDGPFSSGLEIEPTGLALASGSTDGVGPFQADGAYVTGGVTYHNPINIDTSGVVDPAPMAVYQTGRYDGTGFTYTIPGLVPGNSYVVRLHFVEFAHSDSTSRLFNVAINGTQVLSSFSIYAAAGSAMDKAVVEQFAAQADSNGKITILYSAVAGHDGPFSSGLDIEPADSYQNVPDIVALSSGAGAAIGSYASDSAYVTGGATYATSNNVDTSGVIDPAPMAVYQTGRYSTTSFTYVIPGLTPNARYTVRLHFAEFAYSDISSRLFNVSINSTQVLSNFSIYAAAGNAMDRAVVEQFTVQADSNGKITILYSAVAGHDGPFSSGVEIEHAGLALASGSSSGVGSFLADGAYVTGGSAYTNTNVVDTSGVVDPAPPDVYQTGRYDGTGFTYTIPGLVPGNSYVVRLHFVEFAHSDSTSRLFNVAINGTQVLSSFSIYAAAGSAMDKAVVEQFAAQADSNGKITILYSAVAGHDGPFSSGLDIEPVMVTSAATQLAITTQPTSVKTAETFSLTVTAKDANGNLDPNYSGPITLSLAANPGSGMLSGTLTVNAVHGLATFSGLSLNKSASGYLIQASASGLTAATSAAINVTPAATQLAFTTQPPSGVKTAEGFSLTVTAEDANGNLDPNYAGPITLSLAANPGSGMLSGTLTAIAVHGVATFTGLSLNKSASGYLIQASSTGLTAATSTAINVTPAATQLAFTTQPPASVEKASAFSLTVTAEDANGNLDPNYSGPITLNLAANPGNGMLSGTLTANAVHGVATFTGLSLNKPASGYLIQASASGLTATTSAAINVTAATQLAFTTQPPSSVEKAQGFTLTVTAKDASGNLDPNYSGLVTLNLSANPGAGQLSGTLTATAVNGVATFTGLSLNKPASGYLIQASASGLTATTSAAINVTAATQLAFTTQPPSGVKTAESFSLTVSVKDANGNVDPNYSGPITLSLAANPGSGMLSGTLTVQAVYGVATFTGLSLNKSASGYLIQASATGLTAATSTAIAVTPAATQLAFTTQPPSTVTIGVAFSLTVTAEDANGNLDPNYSGTITVALATNPGNGMVSGTLSVQAIHGVATFTDLILNKPGVGYLIKATSSGLTLATSSSITATS